MASNVPSSQGLATSPCAKLPFHPPCPISTLLTLLTNLHNPSKPFSLEILHQPSLIQCLISNSATILRVVLGSALNVFEKGHFLHLIRVVVLVSGGIIFGRIAVSTLILLIDDMLQELAAPLRGFPSTAKEGIGVAASEAEEVGD